MFTQLIALNKRPADDLAGQSSSLNGKSSPSNPLLLFLTPTSLSAIAYKTACSNVLLAINTTFALTLPPDWDGPFGQGLTMGTTVIAVGSAFILGLFSIGIVNSM